MPSEEVSPRGQPSLPGPESLSADVRIHALEQELALRTIQRDEARRMLSQNALAASAVPNTAGFELSSRLHAVVRELERVSEELEERNTALATANWRLEERVTQRTAALKHALAARTRSEDRFRQVAEQGPLIVWTSLPGGFWDFANHRWNDYTGQPVDRALGQGWLDQVHPEDRQTTLDAWREATESHTRLFVEHRLRHSTGTGDGSATVSRDGGDDPGQWRWFETQGLPIPAEEMGADDLGGASIIWVGSCYEVHARKVVEENLRRANEALEQQLQQHLRDLEESEARFHAYFDVAPEPLFAVVLTPDGRFLHAAANPRFEELTGLRAEAIRGRETREFLPPAGADLIERHYRACADGTGAHAFEAVVPLPAGDRALHVTLFPSWPRGQESDPRRGPPLHLLGSAREVPPTTIAA